MIGNYTKERMVAISGWPFVEQQLGYVAMYELESLWQAAVAPIRESDPDEQKYDQAYTSWL